MHRAAPILLVLVSATACTKPPAAAIAPAEPTLHGDLSYLASPALEGRAPGTAGGDSAAVFLARRHERFGNREGFVSCAPGGECEPSYFQHFSHEGMRGENVAAVAEGSDPDRRGRYVLFVAHYDHVGRTDRLALDRQVEGAVRPGADDNASGTVAILELARRVAEAPLPTSALFVHFDVEEWGLIGSETFVDHPAVPLDSIDLVINLDMVGRLVASRLEVEVTAPAEQYEPLIDELAGSGGLTIRKTDFFQDRSDHAPFARAGVPAVLMTTGPHQDYHRVSDTVEKLDLLGMLEIIDFAEALARTVAEGSGGR